VDLPTLGRPRIAMVPATGFRAGASPGSGAAGAAPALAGLGPEDGGDDMGEAL